MQAVLALEVWTLGHTSTPEPGDEQQAVQGQVESKQGGEFREPRLDSSGLLDARLVTVVVWWVVLLYEIDGTSIYVVF